MIPGPAKHWRLLSALAAAALAASCARAPFHIEDHPLPDGTIGVPYSVHVYTRGEAPAETWRLTLSPQVSSLSINSEGLISGTVGVDAIPALSPSGTLTLVVDAREAEFGFVANRSFEIRMLGIPSLQLPEAVFGYAYSQHLVAMGGRGALNWRVSDGSTLPPGLSLSGDGILSGTPSARGTYTFSVQVTDPSETPRTTLPAPLTLFVGSGEPLVSIAVVPAGPLIPVGSTQQFQALGTFADGTTRDITSSVSWTSSNPLTATVTSPFGRATAVAPGATTISANSPVGAVHGSTVLNVAAGGNGNLNGRYVFLFQGTDASGPMAMAGYFAADGNGHLSIFQVDINRRTGFTQANQGTRGTYSVQNENRGSFTVTQVDGSSLGTFQMTLRSFDSTGVAREGSFIEYDSSATRGSGVFKKTGTDPFTVADFAGSAAFGLWGVDSSGQPLAIAGRFDAGPEGILSNASLDFNIGGATTGNRTFTGQYVSPSTGFPRRGTANLQFPSPMIGQPFVIYSASSDEAFVLSINMQTPWPLLAGQMFRQRRGPYSPSSIDGPAVFRLAGGSSTVANLALGQIRGDSAVGRIYGLCDQNNSGSISSLVFNSAYAVDGSGNGRARLILGTDLPSQEFVGYLFDQRAGFLVGATPTPGSVLTGQLEPQVLGVPPISGNYAVATVPNLASGVTYVSGIVAAAGETSGTFAGTASARPAQSGLLDAASLEGTFGAIDNVTGRAPAAIQTLPAANPNGVLYVVSPTRFYLLGLVAGNPTNSAIAAFEK